MSSDEQSNSQKESSMNAAASDELLQQLAIADRELGAAGKGIIAARRRLAAADQKYRERLRGRPGKW